MSTTTHWFREVPIEEVISLSHVDQLNRVDLDTPEGQLLHLLTGESYDFDQLMAKTGLTIEKILGLVTRLELTGSIFQDGAGRYSAKKHG